MMKVLLIAHRVPYPPNKGEKIRTFHHLSHLVKREHDLTVATPLESTEDEDNAVALREKFSIPILTAKLPPKVVRLSMGLLKGQALSVANFYSAALQKQIDTHIEGSSCPQTIYCTSSAMSRYVLNDKTNKKVRERGIRLVMDFMDLDSLKWSQYQERKPWPLSWVYSREAKLLAKTENETLTSFDGSLFVSSQEEALLHKNADWKNKVHAVTNGVDSSSYYPSAAGNVPDASSLKFLFTGVMDYFPNEDAVIWFSQEVWPDIRKRYPAAEFTIAGMRPSAAVKNLANQPGIIVTGFVEDILPYYQQSDFLVAPFRIARGIQNKVLQAMSCGLPVLTSLHGATGINAKPGEHLLITETSKDYLQAIEQLLGDPDEYRAISQASLSLVDEEYNWDKLNIRLEQILSGPGNL